MIDEEEAPSSGAADDGRTEAPSGGPVDVAAEAAALAGNPKRWRALLFAHTANERGECHSCLGVRWPCPPRLLAERAERLHRDTRPGSG